MLKCQPVSLMYVPALYSTWVDQMSVRQRTVCEYFSQLVYHWRPFTRWNPGVV